MSSANHPFRIDLSATEFTHGALAPACGSSSRIATYKKTIHDLPLPPALWQEYQQACSREASNQEIAGIIKSDPVLAGAILGSVNSAGFALRMPINDIGRAISHLGQSMTRSIVAKHAFSTALPLRGKVSDIKMIWKDAMLVSSMAEIVAAYIPGCNAEEAATAGLFHDIGKLGFELVTEYRQPATFDPQQGLLCYELQSFGCTHVDFGTLLAEHWKLPEKTRRIVAHHHHPAFCKAKDLDADIRTEVLAVYLADVIGVFLGFENQNSTIVLPDASYASLINTTSLDEIVSDAKIAREVERINNMEF